MKKKLQEFDTNVMKDMVQDCNINLLIGSGLSRPFLSTLGNIETLLTDLSMEKEKNNIAKNQEKIIRASLYKKYFDGVIKGNLDLLKRDKSALEVLNNYKTFLKILNSIILQRKSTILNKQINVFTTNLDVFLEIALEESNLENNDGFSGRFNPVFDLTNFKKSVFKTSLHYDNIAELPVFNLMKIHGSLTWKKDTGNKIIFCWGLHTVESVHSKIPLSNNFIEVEENDSISILLSKAKEKVPDDSLDIFIEEYEKLAIVNPTKEKFKETVLNQNYYEILRIYSNELEKENTILFVMGFSFADEHIREITRRAVNSNPTLKLFIFSYSNEFDYGARFLKENSINNNVEIISPNKIKRELDSYRLDFENLNQDVFKKLLKSIDQSMEV